MVLCSETPNPSLLVCHRRLYFLDCVQNEAKTLWKIFFPSNMLRFTITSFKAWSQKFCLGYLPPTEIKIETALSIRHFGLSREVEVIESPVTIKWTVDSFQSYSKLSYSNPTSFQSVGMFKVSQVSFLPNPKQFVGSKALLVCISKQCKKIGDQHRYSLWIIWKNSKEG